jgi:hypothetical protein
MHRQPCGHVGTQAGFFISVTQGALVCAQVVSERFAQVMAYAAEGYHRAPEPGDINYVDPSKGGGSQVARVIAAAAGHGMRRRTWMGPAWLKSATENPKVKLQGLPGCRACVL